MRAEEFITESVTEARRNPHVNTQRDRGVRSVVNLLKWRDTRNVGVSMTELPKLGINPQTSYSTPVGVYFYPASYYMGEYGSVPFQEEAPYIQVFEIISDKILYLSDYSKQDYSQDIENLKKLYPNNIEQIEQLDIDARDYGNARVNTPGGHIWYVTYQLSKWLSYGKFEDPGLRTRGKALKHAVLWNTILRQLGYDAAIDDGDGVIHRNEPTQGAVFNPRAIRMIGTIRNKSDRKEGGTIGELVTEKNPSTFVSMLGRAVSSNSLYLFNPNEYEDPPAISGKIYRVFSKFIEVVTEDPDILMELSVNRLKAIAMAAPEKLKPTILAIAKKYGYF